MTEEQGYRIINLAYIGVKVLLLIASRLCDQRSTKAAEHKYFEAISKFTKDMEKL